jgi:hypothetical protein
MSAYEDAAPNVSQLATESQFKAAFPEPDPPQPPLPEPDAAKKLALLMAYRDEYNNNNGSVALSSLARTMGVPRHWAVVCDREVKAALAVVYSE